MRLSIAALAILTLGSNAFKDTSPFLMFSSQEIPENLSSPSSAQLQSAADVLKYTKDFLSSCPSEKYYIITQPSISSTQLSRSSPHLSSFIADKNFKSSLVVSEVVGLKEGDRDELVKLVKEKCGVKESRGFVQRAMYGERNMVTTNWEPEVGGWSQQEEAAGETDAALQANVLKNISKLYSYTFILLSTPRTEVESMVEESVYEADFVEPLHMDLKRDVYVREGNGTKKRDTRPLFEKYQFLTPALFMGLLVGTVLLSILGVGLNAISSLQVSYAAFDKEMGPAAHKKQQ